MTFTLETLDPQAPPECVDASIHVACLYLVPPCDPDLDLRLPICERSCEAIVRLRAEGTCVKLDAFINDLSESSVALRPLRDVYFSFDCRNVSTYDAYEGTLNFTKNGECTSIISPAYEGQTKLELFFYISRLIQNMILHICDLHLFYRVGTEQATCVSHAYSSLIINRKITNLIVVAHLFLRGFALNRVQPGIILPINYSPTRVQPLNC